jgi:NAD(P)H-flavin reductase
MPKAAKWVIDVMESLMASKMPLMQVIDIHYFNSSIKRIRYKGDLSGMDFQPGYAVLIRVSDTECRNYTASFNDITTGILEIIVHLHGNGPGSRLMDQLHIGDQIRISLPRGLKQ